MPRKTRLKPSIFGKKKERVQIPPVRYCGCSKEPVYDFDDDEIKNKEEYVTLNGVWAPERDITNHEDLMALVDEPLFLTGKASWQEKELKANTRELEMCNHFKKKLSPEYLCYFVQELIAKKEQYIKENYQMPVTFYMWYSLYGNRDSGSLYLCYDFLSGKIEKLPFGEKGIILKKQPSIDTFMRKYFKLKRPENTYKVSKLLNPDTKKNNFFELPDDVLKQRYKKFIDEVGSTRTSMIPKRLLL